MAIKIILRIQAVSIINLDSKSSRTKNMYKITAVILVEQARIIRASSSVILTFLNL